MKKSSRGLLVAAAFTVAIPCVSSFVHAGNTWTGGHASSTSWTTAANWSGGTLPTLGSTSTLTFGAAGFLKPSSFIGTNTTVGSLAFNSNVASAVTLSLIGFPTGPQAASNLTMGGAGAPAGITVDSGVAHNVTVGFISGVAGSIVLANDLTINQNSSSSLLLINRAMSGPFGVTKNGVGTVQTAAFETFTGPLNINGGRWITSSFPSAAADAGKDLDSSSGVTLGGAALEIQVGNGAVAKTFAVPVNVTAASTLAYNTLSPSNSRVLTFSGTNSFALNADLTVVNNTAYSATLNNGINITRVVTGTGKMIVQTANNFTSNTDPIGNQRIQLSGNSPLWSGGLAVDRGSVTIASPANATVAGTGTITLGTTGSSLGAGLSFNQAVNVSVTLNNDIIVRSGGFRIIRNGGEFSTFITLGGAVTLENDLTLDHTLGSGRWLTLSGNITGTGGINITRGGGAAAAGSGVRLSGTNTYVGNTFVAPSAALYVDGSVTSAINIAAGGLIGGEGSTTAGVTIGAGGTVSFDGTTTNHFTASGTIDTTAGSTTKIRVQMANPALSGTGIVVLQAGTLVTNGLSDFDLAGRGSLALSGNQLLYNYASGSVIWKGANATSPTFWNTNTPSGNFTLNGASDFFFAGDDVLFDDTASNFAPAVQAPLTAGMLTFNNTGTNSYTVSGASVASTGIVKNGTGTVVLNNDNVVAGNVTVNSGQLIANTPLRPVTGSLVVTGPGASVELAAPATSVAATGYTVVGEFASVSVAASSTVIVASVARAANKASVLVTGGLTLGGTLNLGTSDMIIKGGVASIAAVRGWLASGTLTSSGVAAVAPYTTLSLFPNDAGDGITSYFASYDGVAALASGDLIVKYTYVGDTNLDGTLDGADLSQILEGYSTGQTGWAWGDVNHSGGPVDAADVAAFLAAYNYYQTNSQIPLGSGQGGVGGSGAIPEPTALGLLAATVPMLGRRRRR